jgi:release factor glutamine methyltransferase
VPELAADPTQRSQSRSWQTYPADFGGGRIFTLENRSNTFQLSPAGLALGRHLAQTITPAELSGRILETGTGSGAIALLLRSLGARSITGLDISAGAIAAAQSNELANFGSSAIDFRRGSLFPESSDKSAPGYDLIVFNPPGWRAPSPKLRSALRSSPGLDLDAMFFADTTVLSFLKLLPQFLAVNGRAILGLNSLMGIADVLQRMERESQSPSSLVYRLLERHEFPLVFYTEEWRKLQHRLISQFERGRQEYSAVFVNRGDEIHWFYEITEFRRFGARTLAGSGRLSELSPNTETAENQVRS